VSIDAPTEYLIGGFDAAGVCPTFARWNCNLNLNGVGQERVSELREEPCVAAAVVGDGKRGVDVLPDWILLGA
jgi:hypothetical protein